MISISYINVRAHEIESDKSGMKTYPKQKNFTLRKNAVLITFPKNLKDSSSKVVKTSLFILAKKIFSKILPFLMSHFHTNLAYGTLRKNI